MLTWKSILKDTISYSQSIENAFIYRSGAELDSYKYQGLLNTYDDGGYFYEFRGSLTEMKENLTKLHQFSWIDCQTRAIIIEITLYNSNVQLFTSMTFLIEFFSTGGVFPQSHFQPIDLHDQFQGFSSILHSIFASIYRLLIIYFTLIEIHS
jgi:polycystin 1L2